MGFEDMLYSLHAFVLTDKFIYCEVPLWLLNTVYMLHVFTYKSCSLMNPHG